MGKLFLPHSLGYSFSYPSFSFSSTIQTSLICLCKHFKDKIGDVLATPNNVIAEKVDVGFFKIKFDNDRSGNSCICCLNSTVGEKD